jgi:hypothetical protein
MNGTAEWRFWQSHSSGEHEDMTRFVPPPGPSRVLALAQFTNSVGDGAFYACSALFFTRVVGLSATGSASR